jgi:RimJ/RimL family protein N-acetyltransferase
MDPTNLTTGRLRLRRISAGDVTTLVAISTDPRTNEHRPGGAPTREQSEEIIRGFIGDWERHGIGYWAVERHGELIGVAGIKPVTVRGQACWNLYYRFEPASWGQGLAAEAARAALAVAAKLDPQRPVVARTRPDNAAAAGLAQRIGMVRRPELDWGGLIAFAASAAGDG